MNGVDVLIIGFAAALMLGPIYAAFAHAMLGYYGPPSCRVTLPSSPAPPVNRGVTSTCPCSWCEIARQFHARLP